MRTSQKNLRLSAFTQLFGVFDLNATPMTVTKLIAHDKPNQSTSRSKNEVAGWYIRPEKKHYRFYKIFFNETRSEQVFDNVEFYPQSMKIPRISSADAATLAERYLIGAL